MKQTIIFICRGVAFVLIFLLLLSASSFIFLPKGNAPEDGIHDHKQNSFLGEAPDSIDVVILGNSLGQCGFSPLDIWENYGITAHICASGNQVLYQSRDFLREVFQYHSPKVVILEPHTVMMSSSTLERIQYALEQQFPTILYHDRWKILQPQDFGSEISYTYTDDLKGYHYEYESRETYLDEHMVPTEEATPIWGKNLEYMSEILQLCSDNGAQFIMVSVPSRNCWNYPSHNAIEKLSSEMDIPYLDLNLVDVGIDWDIDTYDRGDHMNYTGAQKVSAYIGQYLTETGLFADKRGLSEYAGWDEALARFRQSTAQ